MPSECACMHACSYVPFHALKLCNTVHGLNFMIAAASLPITFGTPKSLVHQMDPQEHNQYAAVKHAPNHRWLRVRFTAQVINLQPDAPAAQHNATGKQPKSSPGRHDPTRTGPFTVPHSLGTAASKDLVLKRPRWLGSGP